LAVWVESTKPMFRVEFDNRIQEDEEAQGDEAHEQEEEEEEKEPIAGPSKRRKV
jgi:hypothetical protein